MITSSFEVRREFEDFQQVEDARDLDSAINFRRSGKDAEKIHDESLIDD